MATFYWKLHCRCRVRDAKAMSAATPPKPNQSRRPTNSRKKKNTTSNKENAADHNCDDEV
eukprot:scaffold169376_cov50-Attheya_sp.AAC.3